MFCVSHLKSMLQRNINLASSQYISLKLNCFVQVSGKQALLCLVCTLYISGICKTIKVFDWAVYYEDGLYYTMHVEF